jgi:OOP family OmpA-OmpF porin
LSERRARTVQLELIMRHHLPADQVEAVGFGSSQPVADNGNYQSRKKNRRVEFKIWRK